MKMSIYLYIMTFWFSLVSSSRLYKKHVYNSVMPTKDTEPAYNISVWVKQLHLQQCVIVEIGDKFCAVFIEYRPTQAEVQNEVEEYFLGLCDLATLRKWKLCPPAVESERPKECVFQEASESSNQPTRVHRRLCDVTGLAIYGKLCNCSTNIFRGQKLFEVTGFPTCFVPPLPQSICLMGNVCGVYSCRTSTINKIHTVKCNPQCVGRQPFCESTGPETTRASQIYSYWSDWTEPFCDDDCSNNTNGVSHSQALCINKNTGMGAMDCFGPGTNCCPPNAEKCRCYIYEEDGILKLSREVKTKPPVYFDFQQNMLGSQDTIFKRYPRESKKKAKAIKEKYFGKKYQKEDDDEVDDVKELDDGDDEDIVLEENDQEVRQAETEPPEKSETAHRDRSKPDQKVAIDEMEKDLNQTKEESRLTPPTSSTVLTRLKYFDFIFYYVKYYCFYTIIN